MGPQSASLYSVWPSRLSCGLRVWGRVPGAGWGHTQAPCGEGVVFAALSSSTVLSSILCDRKWLWWLLLCLFYWKPSHRSDGDGCGSGRPSRYTHVCPKALTSVVKVAQPLGIRRPGYFGRNLHVEKVSSGRLGHVDDHSAAHRVRPLPWPRSVRGMSPRAMWESGAQPLT